METRFSFLIPTYNFVCVDLVQELSNQIATQHIEAEVVVVDDGSSDVLTIKENTIINTIPYCQFIHNDTNFGSAHTRNMLAEVAQGEYLIFLDSDLFPTSSTFVAQYVAHATDAEVVVGGLSYRTNNHTVCPLRLAFGLKSEVRTAAERNMAPYAKFTASNILMHKSVLQRVRFDNNIKRYGYEDLLFGQELKKKGISVTHIDNPVFHDDHDTSLHFLQKTQTSLHTLVQIEDKIGQMSRIVNIFNKLQKFHLTSFMRLVFSLFHLLMERQLLSQHPSMLIFNIYKLGYYCTIKRLSKE